MPKIKLLVLLGVLFLFFFIHSSLCLAFGNFSISYNNNYQVLESGITKVNQNISLKNLSSDYYATEYTMILVGQTVNNVIASDRLGPLKTEVKNLDNQTQIHVLFNDRVAGINNTLNWTLNYETASFAFKNGLVWEIYLPGPPTEESLGDYNVSLTIPESFGPALYVWPAPSTNYHWTKSDLNNGGISASFGKYQIFNFNLLYHLKNRQLIDVETEIALPPDTNYQRVNFTKIKPKPINVYLDKDGNWLAEYNLKPTESLEISVEGFSQLNFQPTYQESLSAKDINLYLTPKKYWETDNPIIKAQAEKLKTPRAIYDFVVNTLKYDYKKLDKPSERLGALKAIQHKDQAICLEFTDLFVALARAAGIPARVNNGFAYTTNSKLRPLDTNLDILHAWPEYYDSSKKQWIMIDPTWGNTTDGLDYFNKLDLNHFVLAKKGFSSIYPYAAGSYKNGSKQKDVLISLSNTDRKIIDGDIKVYFKFSKKLYLGKNNQGVIEIRNDGPGSVNLGEAIVTSNPNLIYLRTQLGKIPPFGKRDIPILLKRDFLDLLKTKKQDIYLTLQINNNLYNESVRLEPFILNPIVLIGFGGILVIIIIFIITRKSRHLPLS